jgi:hypothetical protein
VAIGTSSPPAQDPQSAPADAATTDAAAGAPPDPVVPEQYDFADLGEGVTLDTELADVFSEHARDLKLTQEQATQWAQFYASKVLPMQEAQVQKQAEAWFNEIKADPVMGGANFEATLATNGRVMAHILAADPVRGQQLHELLSGPVGNHPAVAWLVSRVIGPLVGEPAAMPRGTPAGVETKPKTLAEAFGYRNQD